MREALAFAGKKHQALNSAWVQDKGRAKDEKTEQLVGRERLWRWGGVLKEGMRMKRMSLGLVSVRY